MWYGKEDILDRCAASYLPSFSFIMPRLMKQCHEHVQSTVQQNYNLMYKLCIPFYLTRQTFNLIHTLRNFHTVTTNLIRCLILKKPAAEATGHC